MASAGEAPAKVSCPFQWTEDDVMDVRTSGPEPTPAEAKQRLLSWAAQTDAQRASGFSLMTKLVGMLIVGAVVGKLVGGGSGSRRSRSGESVGFRMAKSAVMWGAPFVVRSLLKEWNARGGRGRSRR